MSKINRIAISLAAISMVAAPVVASAAPGSGGARATSAVSDGNGLGGGSSWIIGLIGLLAGVTAAILITDDDDDDAPVSI